MEPVPRTRWWSKSRGLPAETYDAWRASLAADAPGPARILAWAEAESGHVVAGPAVLSVGDLDGGFVHVGWHQIENGSWNSETRQLSWAQYGGRRGSVRLTAPGQLPEVFRERIAASIAVERFLPVTGERGVVLNGRRDLAAADPKIEWHATLGRGLSWRTPGLREAVDAALAELRLEYDPGQVP